MNKLNIHSAINVDPSEIKTPQPDLTSTSLQTILEITLGIFGAVAVFIIMWGAFNLVISRGNPEAMGKARNTVIYAAIGLMVIILSFSIVSFVVGKTK